MSCEEMDFAGLIAAIRHAHMSLFTQASKAVNTSLTLRNWFIGHYIAEYELRGADRAKYGERLLKELATALQNQQVSNCGRRQLYGYRCYSQIVRTASAQSDLSTLLEPFFVGVKQGSSALPAFDLRGSKGKAGETFALPLRKN